MKLRWLLSALGLALVTVGAQAQAGVYLNPIVTHASTSQADSGLFAFLGSGVTSREFGGVSMGALYDFGHGPGVKFGLDMRDELEHGNNALLNSFLIGARVSGDLRGSKLRPYAQLSGGVGTTRSPQSSARADKAMYKVYVGLDYRIAKYVDVRLPEIGYGSLSTINSSTYGTPANVPSVDLLSFSGGLVFRFR